MSSHELWSKLLKGGFGRGVTVGFIKGDTRSLDCSSCEDVLFEPGVWLWIVLGFSCYYMTTTESTLA